jgi:hypothetical protein
MKVKEKSNIQKNMEICRMPLNHILKVQKTVMNIVQYLNIGLQLVSGVRKFILYPN